MKVLHLPSNIASQMSVTVQALRDLGIEARGLVYGGHQFCDAVEVETYPRASLWRNPLQAALKAAAWWRAVGRAIRWADVIHWHFKTTAWPLSLDLSFAARLGKARLVEFWGTDIRDREGACNGNPYFTALCREHPKAAGKDSRQSRAVQRRFGRRGFAALVPGVGLREHLQPDLFGRVYYTRQRMLTGQFSPCYPDPRRTRPVVVHAPSHEAKKGTDHVLPAVESLRRHCDFEFRLLHGMSHAQTLAAIRQCDVFLDQFVIGSHGIATLEAMALGKPTVCYIKPSLVSEFPAELPIVNANQHNLAEVLRGLLEDGPRRHDLGRRSRAYVEQYHDAHELGRDLVQIYEDLLAGGSRKARGAHSQGEGLRRPSTRHHREAIDVAQ